MQFLQSRFGLFGIATMCNDVCLGLGSELVTARTVEGRFPAGAQYRPTSRMMLANFARLCHNFLLPTLDRNPFEEPAMLVRLTLMLAFLHGLSPAAAGDDKLTDWRKVIQTVARQGRGTGEGRAAWDRLSGAGAEVLPAILEAMADTDTVAGNWLRTAFDQIVEREFHKGGKAIDAKELQAFVTDTRHTGRARRLALEVVERLQPGTSDKLYPGWLEDPEFRYEAVAALLKNARALSADEASALYRKALHSARDVQQARDAAAGLLKVGVEVSVAEHLGFLTDWYLIGPFDGKGMKGFHIEYAPEKKVDLAQELDGQNGKVRWQRYKVKEAAPTSRDRHQALVNLAAREALGNADDAVAFAYTEFSMPAAQEVEFRGAADDNFTVWVNGVKAFAFEEWRNGVRLDRHRFKVQLKAGKNSVLVKICQSPAPNPEPNWEFFLRVVDATGKGIAMKNALAGK